MKYRFQDQPAQSWASVKQAGIDNANVLQLDASGTTRNNRILHTELISASSDISLQTRLRLSLSNVVVNNPNSSGLAVRHRGFKLTGTEPDTDIDEVVWDSRPEEQGARAWVSGNHSDFRTYAFVTKLPTDTTHIDYVSFELVMSAVSGNALIDDVSCKHFYSNIEILDITGVTRVFQGGMPTTVYNDVAGQPISRPATFVRTRNFRIPQGKRITVSVETVIGGQARQVIGGVEQPCPCDFGLSLLMKPVDSLEREFFDLCEGFSDSSAGFRTRKISESRQVRTRKDYDAFTVVAFVEPMPSASASNSFMSGFYANNILIDLIEDDFVTASQ